MLDKIKNGLVKYVAKPAIAVGLALNLGGCVENTEEYFSKHKEKDGLTIKAWRSWDGNYLMIDEGRGGTPGRYLFAQDVKEMYSDSIDERFDKLYLRNVPKGHSIEKYANLDSINCLFKEVKETGREDK